MKLLFSRLITRMQHLMYIAGCNICSHHSDQNVVVSVLQINIRIQAMFSRQVRKKCIFSKDSSCSLCTQNVRSVIKFKELIKKSSHYSSHIKVSYVTSAKGSTQQGSFSSCLSAQNFFSSNTPNKWKCRHPKRERKNYENIKTR